MTRAEVETNRNSIANVWTIDEPIEDLWQRLNEIQLLAAAADEAISDTTIMELTVLMFESTGVFTSACSWWYHKASADKTLENFIVHFTDENRERLHKFTSTQASFHGANAAMTMAPSVPVLSAPSPNVQHPSPAPSFNLRTNDGALWYYCHSHGLGTNPTHTSATCQRRLPGHQVNATASNMMGGNNTINDGFSHRRRLTGAHA